MRPPNPRLLPDVIRVYAPVDGTDADGGPTQTDGDPADLPAAVQPRSTTTDAATRDEAGGQVLGTTHYRILTAADPGVARADVAIDWITHAGVALATPLRLTSTGPARPPGGLNARWTTDAEAIG